MGQRHVCIKERMAEEIVHTRSVEILLTLKMLLVLLQ